MHITLHSYWYKDLEQEIHLYCVIEACGSIRVNLLHILCQLLGQLIVTVLIGMERWMESGTDKEILSYIY